MPVRRNILTSFDRKWCNSDKMPEQKLNYIHNNPCKGKWNLANNIVEYVHSSAKYYLTGEQGIYEVTHYKDIEAIDLHSLALAEPQRPTGRAQAMHGDVAGKEVSPAIHTN